MAIRRHFKVRQTIFFFSLFGIKKIISITSYHMHALSLINQRTIDTKHGGHV